MQFYFFLAGFLRFSGAYSNHIFNQLTEIGSGTQLMLGLIFSHIPRGQCFREIADRQFARLHGTMTNTMYWENKLVMIHPIKLQSRMRWN